MPKKIEVETPETVATEVEKSFAESLAASLSRLNGTCNRAIHAIERDTNAPTNVIEARKQLAALQLTLTEVLNTVANIGNDYAPPASTKNAAPEFAEGDKVKVKEGYSDLYGKQTLTVTEVVKKPITDGSSRHRTFLKCRTPQDKTIVALVGWFERA